MSEFEKYLTDYLNNFLKEHEKNSDKTEKPKDIDYGKDKDYSKDKDYGKDKDKGKGKPDDKEKPDKSDPDIKNLVASFFAFILNYIVQQKSRNIVLSNGNNNTVQIPNESGPGSNIQV
jgi:hypothetical protein